MSRKRAYNHDEIRQLKARGFSIGRIASKLGCADSTVRAALDKDYAKRRRDYANRYNGFGGPPPREPKDKGERLANL